jgi:hypothetical protein
MYVYVVITSNGEGLNDNNIMLFTDGILSDYIGRDARYHEHSEKNGALCTGVIFVNISQMTLFTDRVGRPQDHFDLEKPEHARSWSV